MIKKLCIVGLGKHALFQIDLLKKFRSDIEITDLVDSSIASYYRCLDTFNGELRSSYSKNISSVLKRKNLDVIYISTLSDSHIKIALEIIESGYSNTIIIEKPISNSLANVNILKDKILNIKWEGNIYVGFYRRNNNLLKKIKEIVMDSEICELKKISYFGSVEVSMNGSHWIDFANWINPKKRIDVSSELIFDQVPGRRGAKILDPFCNLTLNYSNGVEFSISSELSKKEDCLILLKFSKGEIHINRQEDSAQIITSDKKYEISLPGSKNESFINFIDSIEKSDDNLPGINEGYEVLETVIGAHISDKNNNNNISFPLNTSDESITLNVG